MFKSLCIAFMTAFSLTAFADTSTVATESAKGDLSDKEIAKVLLTINDGEINDAKLASQRAKHPEVKAFAKMMMDQHQTNMKDTKALAKKMSVEPVTSDLSVLVQQDSQTAYKDLKNQPKKDFDKAYIDEQIKMHEAALDTVNNKLLPTAENAELKAHLEKTSAAVTAHLEHAKSLKSKLE